LKNWFTAKTVEGPCLFFGVVHFTLARPVGRPMGVEVGWWNCM
jgi:hypothetical protein